MDIHCKRCKTALSAADVNLDNLVGRCTSCNAVFDIAGQVGRAEARPDTRLRAEVPLPEGIAITWGDEAGAFGTYRQGPSDGLRDVTITRRWLKLSQHVFMLGFAGVWCAFLVFWYSTAFQGEAPWIVFVFPLIHVAVGVGMLYGALAGFLNSTTVTVRNGQLTVTHGPLPWRGNRTLDAAEIEQLYCTRKESRGKNGSTVTFTLEAQRVDGSALTLTKNLPELSQALFLEQRLERALAVTDREVAGEVAR